MSPHDSSGVQNDSPSAERTSTEDTVEPVPDLMNDHEMLYW